MNRESLLFKILSSKYFTGGNVLNGRLGSQPSFTWHSIYRALEVIEAGTSCWVGNDMQINIWEDRWLPIPWSFKVQMPINTLLSLVQVFDLLLPHNEGWDKQMVQSIF